jgi:hypothetical protein
MTYVRKEELANGVGRPPRPSMLPQKRVTIYALCEPESGLIRYVGKTRYTPERRLTYHLTQSRSSRLPSANWLRSLNLRGFRPIMVELERVGLNDDWASRERFWISACKDAGFRLLNLTDGGEGAHGFEPTDEHRSKISQALKTGAEFECQACGSLFWRKQFDILNGNNKFCSRGCYQQSLRGVSRPVSIACVEAGVAAAAAARKARKCCKRGHPLSGDNLFITSNGARGCKECRKLHKLTYRGKANARLA